MTNHAFRITGVMFLLIALLSGFGCGSGPQNTNNAAIQGQNQNSTPVSNTATANTKGDDIACGLDVEANKNNVTAFLRKAFEANGVIEPRLKDFKYVVTEGKSQYGKPVRLFITGNIDDNVRAEILKIITPLRESGCIASVLSPKSGKYPSLPNQSLPHNGEDPSFWVECQHPQFPCPQGCMALPCEERLDTPTPVPTP